MMNIEVPLFWHLEYAVVPEEGKTQGKRPPRIEPKQALTANELAHAERLRNQVVYLKLRHEEGERAATVFEIADLFQKYGDINVVKNTATSCFVDLQHVDWASIDRELGTGAPNA